MDISGVIKPAKTSKPDGSRGFVFAAEVSDETKDRLDAIRDKAKAEGKVMSNVALAEAAIGELYRAYVQGGTLPEE